MEEGGSGKSDVVATELNYYMVVVVQIDAVSFRQPWLDLFRELGFCKAKVACTKTQAQRRWVLERMVESLRDGKEVAVAFCQLRNGYQASETISAKLTYGKLFDPSPEDSIVIIPAGYIRVYQFAATQPAPMRPKTSVTVKIENSDDTEELFPVMPRVRQIRIMESAAKRKPVTVNVVFKNHRLPSRNFYQLAYVQRATSDILATSSVFFVEPTSESPMVAFSNAKPIRRKSPIREQPLISSRNWSHQANSTPGTSNMITGALRPSWRSFFCGTSEATASFVLTGEDERDDGLDFEEDDSSASCDVPPERQRLLDCSVDDGFEDEKDKANLYPASRTPSTASSIAQFLIDLWRQPFSAPSNSLERRTASMYEIGATSYGNQTPSMINAAEPYQKMVCQLTKSNNALLHENERLSRRVQHLEMALQENTGQLHSLYYTLNRNGIDSVVLPNGEEVQLSQFRGQLLNFTKSSEMLRNGSGGNGYASRQMRFERTIEQHSSESSSSGSLDQDELKAAMLKCITKSKYNDLDDFVNWLNDDRSPSRVVSYERTAHRLPVFIKSIFSIPLVSNQTENLDPLKNTCMTAFGSVYPYNGPLVLNDANPSTLKLDPTVILVARSDSPQWHRFRRLGKDRLISQNRRGFGPNQLPAPESTGSSGLVARRAASGNHRNVVVAVSGNHWLISDQCVRLIGALLGGILFEDF